MRLKTLAFATAGCLVAVGAVVPIAGAIADQPAPPSATTRIITGTLSTADGAPFHSGTPVTLSALGRPDAATGSAEYIEVAATRVGSDGSFDLRTDDIAGLSDYASTDGIIDFEVKAIDGDEFAPYSFSRTLTTIADVPALVEPGSELASPRSARAAVTKAVAPVKIGALPGAAAPVSARTGSSRTQVCGEDPVGKASRQRVVVGASYANTANVTGTMTYSTGASTAIGVGYSISGKFGTYKQQGALSKTTKTSIVFGARNGNYGYSTYFNFQKHNEWCYPIYSGPSAKKVYAHKYKAVSYPGGSHVRATTAPAATHCTDFANGTHAIRQTSTSSSWATGVVVSEAIGISMSTRTGFSSQAKLDYLNKSGGSRKLCGTTGEWGATPGRVVVKK